MSQLNQIQNLLEEIVDQTNQIVFELQNRQFNYENLKKSYEDRGEQILCLNDLMNDFEQKSLFESEEFGDSKRLFKKIIKEDRKIADILNDKLNSTVNELRKLNKDASHNAQYKQSQAGHSLPSVFIRSKLEG